MDEKAVQDFWQNHACGDALVGGLRERFGSDYEKFFSDYDKFRYELENHLPACFDALNVTGKRVLEIGLGQGADCRELDTPRRPLVRCRSDGRVGGARPEQANPARPALR